jgi:hypothetical protein
MSKNWMEAAAQREGKGNKAKTKSAFYRLQREHAEESGDQKTTDKIYGKLGKKSHNVDSSRGDKAILGAAPFLPEAAAGLGEMAAARAAGGLARKALGKGGTALAKRAEGASQTLRTPTPVKRALTDNSRKLGEVIQKTPKRLDSIGKPKPKALSSGGHSEFEAELAKMSKKSGTPGQKALPAYSKKVDAPKMSTKDIIKNREMRQAHAESKGEVYSRSKERTPRITTGTKPKTFNRDGSKNTRRDTPVNTPRKKKGE